MIGKTIKIKGEITADEDLVVDGQVEGKISLTKDLIVGKSGQINANVQAQSVTLGGRFKGDIHARDRVALESTAFLEGNVAAPRLSISDGAYFKGSVDMGGADKAKK
jgi:cytoskeletal protein CcmA (bactofilin family)